MCVPATGVVAVVVDDLTSGKGVPSLSTNQIARFVNYHGYGKFDRIFYSIEELITIGRD